MKVLHVIPSVSKADGGPSIAVVAMAEALAEQRVEVTIVTTEGEQPDHRTTDNGLQEEEEKSEVRGQSSEAATGDYGYKVVSFPRNLESYKVSFGLAKWLSENIIQFELVHVHALFSFSSTVAARIARRNGVPYIVRPLGVLNRWGMQNRRRLPKAVSFRLLELPILLGAASIHYTSEAEQREAGELDRKLAAHESAVIPLPIEIGDLSDIKGQRPEVRDRTIGGEEFSRAFPQMGGEQIVIFLSRIDRKKGLELLLDAFAIVRRKNENVALVIAGNGEQSYVRELQERSSTSENSSHIIWAGHLTGEMKSAALAAADIFVLPSASENFGIAAAESLAAGVPTIVSEEVALSDDIRRYDAGLVVKRDVQELAAAIDDLLSDRERVATLARNGRRLAEDRYSSEAVGKALLELYSKILRTDH